MVKVVKESALSKSNYAVKQISFDMLVPGDEKVKLGPDSGFVEGLYKACESSGYIMASDSYGIGVDDITGYYDKENIKDLLDDVGIYNESLKESFESKMSIEDGANQLLSDLFEKLGVDPQAAGQFSRWDEVIDWITSVVMQLKGIPFNYDESLKEARGSRKPKYWNTMFATKVIDAYKDGKLSLDNIDDWETEYNGGTKPSNLGTKDILTYHIHTGSDPRNESLKESKDELRYLPKTSTQIARNVIELAIQKFGGKMIRIKSKTSDKTSYVYRADSEDQLAKAKEFIDSKINPSVNVESPKVTTDVDAKDDSVGSLGGTADNTGSDKKKKTEAVDDNLTNYTIEFTYGDGDFEDEDIMADDAMSAIDDFWSRHEKDSCDIISVYDWNGVTYDSETGEETYD